MSRKSMSMLQKTYDDTYLKCSTAVYYESQGNEDDAMRCWKNALDEINDHHAAALHPSYSPKSETEKALIDSLKHLELQCKERIDLLGALRASRQENITARHASLVDTSVSPGGSSSPGPLPRADKGWIGEGTVPAFTYPELSSRPPLPTRPSLPDRTSSEKVAINGRPSESLPVVEQPSGSASAPAVSHQAQPNKSESSPRVSPNPEKQHTMRTTLRSGKTGEKTAKLTRKSGRAEGPGASKAATLAWSALGSRETMPKGHSSGSDSTLAGTKTDGPTGQPLSRSGPLQWNFHTRRLVASWEPEAPGLDSQRGGRHSDEYPYTKPSALSVSAASSALNSGPTPDNPTLEEVSSITPKQERTPRTKPSSSSQNTRGLYASVPAPGESSQQHLRTRRSPDARLRSHKNSVDHGRRSYEESSSELEKSKIPTTAPVRRRERASSQVSASSDGSNKPRPRASKRPPRHKGKDGPVQSDSADEAPDEKPRSEADAATSAAWKKRQKSILKNLPSGVDQAAAKQILNEIVVKGDEVRWSDIAGLEVAKNALRETVVYPFLRPDLFMGLREPARGMLLFGPPGTGKTMLARAVATESRSTFFSISASSLTSKFLGESEKLVRALFILAKELAPSIIFVDEIDSLLSQRSGSGEHEATRRIKTEFLIQWSDLQRAAAGRGQDPNDSGQGDPNRVLVLAATNMPWAIDEAARRRFVRRQYIPLPEPETRSTQLHTLLGEQNHGLSDADIGRLVTLTEGFSGSDITALAKDAAMGPLRSLGDAVLHMTMEDIRPIQLSDFEASLLTIRPSVGKNGLKEYEDWAREYGERGG